MNDRKDRIRVQIGGQEFFVVGGGFQEMLSAVKQINGRRFVSEAKVWQLPGQPEQIQNQLDISGYRLEKGGPAAAKPAAAPASNAGGDRVRVLIGGQRLAVIGGSFQDMLGLVKSLPQRRFDSDTKLWEISGEVGVIKGMIEAAGFQLEGAANLSLGPVPPMETPYFGGPGDAPPPPFEAPDFFDDDELEPPPWLMEDLARRNFEEDYFTDASVEDTRLPFTPEPLPTRSSSAYGGDRIRVSLEGLPLVVSGGSFQEMLALIKSLPGRRFNAEERVWEIPNSMSLEVLSQRIAAAGFVLEQE